jgi:glycosyltransferase involved in cell wall biosynthesis
MQVLQVIPYFNERRGGDVNVCKNVSIQLSKRGHDVTIMTSDFQYDENLAMSARRMGVEIMKFESVLNAGLLIYTPSMSGWLAESAKSFDIIHIQGYRSYQAHEVNRHAVRHHIPVVLQAHGTVLPFFQKIALKRLYDYVWGHRILRNVCLALALSEAEKGQYKKMGISEDRIRIVPNGIDLSPFACLPSKGSFKKKYGIRDAEKVILYLGRIHRIKGVDLLLDAYSELLERRRDIRLVIAGPDDGFESALRRRARELQLEDKMLFVGALYGRDKIEAFVDAQVYVLPSRYEVFPNTVLEAWACGVPVVVTDVCGISGIVRKTGGVVVPRDKHRMSVAIASIIDDDMLRNQLGENGKRLVRREFEWTAVIEKIEQVYDECIKSNPSSGRTIVPRCNG